MVRTVQAAAAELIEIVLVKTAEVFTAHTLFLAWAFSVYSS